MSGDYLWDRSGPRDPEVVRLERVLGVLRQQEPPRPLTLPAHGPGPRRPVAFVVAFAAVAAMVIVLAGVSWSNRAAVTPGVAVTRLTGTPTIASRPVDDRGQLAVGHWLETDAHASASIDIANVGRLEIDPGTRIGLVSTRPGDHRLNLVHGTVHALIWAPPGQFFVQTPSSTAVDLGCAYTLTVDDEGVGLVTVTSGWVGFQWRGRETFIPAGAMGTTRRGLGPGTPHFGDTSPAFRAALDTIDLRIGTANVQAGALDLVLAEARPRDTVTLWHLLSRLDGAERDRVFDRLATFVPPPPGVTRDGVRAGRQDMLDQWWDTLGLGAATWWRVWEQPWKDK